MDLDCHSVRERFGDYLDRSLPLLARERVDAHLGGCASCARAMEMTRDLVAALGEVGDPPLPDGFAQRLSARLHQEAERMQPAPSRRARKMPRRTWAERLAPLMGPRPLAGIAVSLVLAVAFLNALRLPSGNMPALTADGPQAVAVSAAGTVQPVHMAYGNDAVVRIRFEAARPVEQVRFTLELPPGVRMVQDGKVIDAPVLTWEGRLEEGINQIPLHVRGVARGEWTVTASVEKGGVRKQRSIGLLVNGA